MSDRLGEDIHLLDVRDVSPMMDFSIIASGTSTPHLKAMYEDIQKQLKKEGVAVYGRSGVAGSGWMVLDYVDVVIHIFSREMREYYGLESLWDGAKRVA
ncbi:MAG: ribosome silencing factor [Kiritimatiellae bacterium]|nr:ribosome silencing factor [Kiritimatiellia bacterium]